MTKAREIAELGQKLTVDGSGNLEFAGDLELGDNNKAIFGASSDLQIYHDSASGQSIIHENGPSVLKIRATDFRISNAANTADYLSANNGAEVSIRYNGAVKLATTNTGIDVTGNALASDTFEIDSGGTGFLVGGGQTGTTAIGKLHNSAGVLTLDTDGSRSIQFSTGGSAMMRVDGNGNGIIINESGADQDFRVESDSNTHALFVDAGLSRVGINLGTPGAALDVLAAASEAHTARFKFGDSNGGYVSFYNNTASAYAGYVGSAYHIVSTSLGSQDFAVRSDGTYLVFSTAGANERLRLSASATVFNESGADTDFRVETDASTHTLFVEGSTDRVGLFTSAPNYDFQVGHQNVNTNRTIAIASAGDSEKRLVFRRSTSEDWIFKEDTSENFSIDGLAGKELVINQAGADVDFRVESTNRIDMLKVDAGSDQVSIQETLSPSSDWTLRVGNARNLYFQPSLGSTGFYNAGMGFSAYVDSSSTPNQIILPAGRNTNGGSVIAANYDGGLGFFVYDHGGTGAATANIFSYEKMTLKPSEAVFNENGSDVNFRVESNNQSDMFIIDAGDDQIRINNAEAKGTGPMVIRHDAAYSSTQFDDQPTLYLQNEQSGNGDAVIVFEGNTSSNSSMRSAIKGGYYGLILTGSANNTAGDYAGELRISNGNASFGEVIVNDLGKAETDFRVESDTNANALFVDAGNNSVKVGGTSDSGAGSYRAELAVNGTYGQVYGNVSTWIVTVAMGGGQTVTLGTYTGDTGASISAHLVGHHHYSTGSSGTSAPLGVYQIMSAMRKAGTSYTVINNQVVDSFTQGGASVPSLEFDNSNGQLKVVTAVNQGCYAEIRVVFQTNYQGAWTPSY